MKHVSLVAFALLVAASALSAQVSTVLEEADAQYEDQNYEGAITLLERALPGARSGRERAEILWRLSRAKLQQGAELEFRGRPTDQAMELYAEGERLARSAVEADPSNHEAYFWVSANIGKAAQIRGVLNSLFAAGDMRDLLHSAIRQKPDHVESYYVLSQMYRQLPGIISFGNVDFAVSLARRAADLHDREIAGGVREEVNHDIRTQLAAALIARNWDSNRRLREQEGKRNRYERERDILEQSFRYEGTVRLPRLSDREEARNILQEVIRSLEAIRDRTRGQEEHLEEARTFLRDLR